MGKHLTGPKITSSHTSAIDLAGKVVGLLEKLPTVHKITLGVIKPNLKPSVHRIKSIPITGGLRLAIRGTTSIQQVFIYGSEVSGIIRYLEEKLRIPVR